MRGCRLLSVVVMAMAAGFCLGTWSLGWASPGDLKWKYSSSGDRGALIAIDGSGNRILVTTSFDSDSAYRCHVISVNKDGHLNWQRAHDNVYATSIAIDSEDNIIVVGHENSGGGADWKIISYSPSGDINWEESYDSGYSSDMVFSVAIDSEDNAIMVGYVGYLHPDWKVISYSSSGHINWERSYGSRDHGEVAANLVVDSRDNVIVVGYENDGSDNDWKIISYSPSGGVNWQCSYDSELGSDAPMGVAIDSRDNVIVVGYENSGRGNEWKIISYSPSGGVNWQRSYDGEHGDDVPMGVAIDSRDNVIVVGYQDNGSDNDWKIISYSPSGDINWQTSYDGEHGDDLALGVAIDSMDNAIVVGYENNGSDNDWKIISYSSAGEVEWQASYDSRGDRYSASSAGRVKGDRAPMEVSYGDKAENVCIDRLSGDVVIGGYILDRSSAFMIDCEGYPPAVSGHVLIPAEVRTVQPAAETPDANPTNGTYLGFGDVVANGTHFKVEAAFPAYLNQSDNSTLTVKIFIAAQMPDDYSRLAYFDSSNNMKFQPPDKLSSWKSSVSGEVAKTTIYPEVDVTSALSNIPTGTHYWYTLVVPATVPDDFSGVDWSITPWEITVNVFDVK